MQTTAKELMTADPVIIPSDLSLREAAQKMKSVNCGVLPVGTWDNLEGMITDRDIVVRAVAENIDIAVAKVRDYMTKDVFYCQEDDSLADVVEQMRSNNVSRLVVKDSNGQACGIITFGCIIRKNKDVRETGEVIGQVVGMRAA